MGPSTGPLGSAKKKATLSPLDGVAGPTQAFVLIDAAAMVTNDIFVIARRFPLFEYPHTDMIVITFKEKGRQAVRKCIIINGRPFL